MQKIVDASGPFSAFRSPAINDLGTVVFFGFLDAGPSGIFTGPDPVAHRVIATGDPLFGSTVTGLGFFRGLNERNEVVFSFSLADGRNGIARAKLNPGQGAQTTFAHWQRAYFTPVQLNDPAVSAPEADPAADGTPNLLKYAYNLDPLQPSAARQPVASKETGTLAITYTKMLGAADLAYTIEQSSDLTQWTPVAPTNEVVADDGIQQRIIARVPTAGSPDKLYLRLRVATPSGSQPAQRLPTRR